MPDHHSLEDQIVVALRRITRANDLRSRMLLQHYGLTSPQLAALKAIEGLQPVTAGRVASEIHLGHPTVTGILNRLENRGLLRRVRGDADRRSVSISLTDEGLRVLTDSPPQLQDRFQDELSELEPWERTQILATLQRIADMMDAKRTGDLESFPPYPPEDARTAFPPQPRRKEAPENVREN